MKAIRSALFVALLFNLAINSLREVSIADESELKSTDSSATSVSKEDPAPKVDRAQPIDLTHYYHTTSDAFNKSEKYPWRDVIRGKQTLAGIPFQIGGRIVLWGQANAQNGLVFPAYVEGIEVERKFESLYILHATFYQSATGTAVSELIMNFDDDSSESFEIQYGVHTADWLMKSGTNEGLTDPNSKLVWKTASSVSRPDALQDVRFFVTEIPNPHPHKLVKSIDLVSSTGICATCYLAISAGEKGLIKSSK